jgi:tight adherence protein B
MPELLLKAGLFAAVYAVAFFGVRRLLRQVTEDHGDPLENYLGWVAGNLDQLNVGHPPAKARALVAWSAAGAAAGGLALSQSLPVAALFGLLGLGIPVLAVREMHRRRRARFDTQLVDALNLVANSLRAGLSLPQSLEILSREMPAPISEEFAIVLKEYQMGVQLNEALERLSRRMRNPNLDIVVTSVNVLRETGGRLTETFDTIANTIRERDKVQLKIRTYTAQGRMQAYIISAMPVILGLLFHVIDPAFIRPLYTTPLGWLLLFVMVLLQATGLTVIMKAVRVDV